MDVIIWQHHTTAFTSLHLHFNTSDRVELVFIAALLIIIFVKVFMFNIVRGTDFRCKCDADFGLVPFMWHFNMRRREGRHSFSLVGEPHRLKAFVLPLKCCCNYFGG